MRVRARLNLKVTGDYGQVVVLCRNVLQTSSPHSFTLDHASSSCSWRLVSCLFQSQNGSKLQIIFASCSLCHRRHTPWGSSTNRLPSSSLRRGCRRGRCQRRAAYALFTTDDEHTEYCFSCRIYIKSHTTRASTSLKQDKTYDPIAPRNQAQG